MSELETIYDTGSHKMQVGKQDTEKAKIYTERQWRNSELLRTDDLVSLPDYPVELLSYRSALRDYPAQTDFPNGERPNE